MFYSSHDVCPRYFASRCLTNKAEWIIWAPLVSLSTGFLLAIISAEYRTNARQDSDDNEKVPPVADIV
jgi:hypothetical protein